MSSYNLRAACKAAKANFICRDCRINPVEVLKVLDEVEKVRRRCTTWQNTVDDKTVEVAAHIAYKLKLEDEVDHLQQLLPHLVDVVWGEANEDESVPSSDWAKRMIEKAKRTLDG